MRNVKYQRRPVLLGSLFFVMMVLLFSCENFLKSDSSFTDILAEELRIANAVELSVQVSAIDTTGASTGTVSPNGKTTVKMGVETTLTFILNSNYGVFDHWAIFSNDNLSKELGTDIATFSAPTSTTTTVIMNVTDSEKYTIIPVCVPHPSIMFSCENLTGTITPAMAYTSVVGTPISATFTCTDKYGFVGWNAYISEDYNANGLGATPITDESIILFDPSTYYVSGDKSYSSVNVILKTTRSDIVVVPKVVLRPQIKNLRPSNGSTGVNRVTSIQIWFSKPMDPKSFIYEYNADGTPVYRKDIDGDGIEEFKNLSITGLKNPFDTNNTNTYTSIIEYFNDPKINDARTAITFTSSGDASNPSSLLASYMGVNYSVSGEVCDTDGMYLGDDYSVNYITGSSCEVITPEINSVQFSVDKTNWSNFDNLLAYNNYTDDSAKEASLKNSLVGDEFYVAVGASTTEESAKVAYFYIQYKDLESTSFTEKAIDYVAGTEEDVYILTLKSTADNSIADNSIGDLERLQLQFKVGDNQGNYSEYSNMFTYNLTRDITPPENTSITVKDGIDLKIDGATINSFFGGILDTSEGSTWKIGTNSNKFSINITGDDITKIEFPDGITASAKTIDYSEDPIEIEVSGNGAINQPITVYDKVNNSAQVSLLAFVDNEAPKNTFDKADGDIYNHESYIHFEDGTSYTSEVDNNKIWTNKNIFDLDWYYTNTVSGKKENQTGIDSIKITGIANTTVPKIAIYSDTSTLDNITTGLSFSSSNISDSTLEAIVKTYMGSIVTDHMGIDNLEVNPSDSLSGTTVKCTTSDRCGNSTSWEKVFYIDLTAPSLSNPAIVNTSYIDGGTVYIKDASSSIKFTASDNLSGLEKLYVQKGEDTPSEISLDTTTGSYIWTPGSAGNYSVIVKDNAGNESTSKTFVVTVDATVPTIDTDVFKQVGSAYYVKQSTEEPPVPINLAITEENSGIKSVTVGAVTLTVTDSKCSWTPSTAGACTITVTDNVGNVSEYDVTVDGTAPKIEDVECYDKDSEIFVSKGIFTNPENGSDGSLTVPNTIVEFIITDTGSGFNSISIGTDDFTDKGNNLYSWTPGDEGDGTLVITDKVGNKSEYKVIVDGTAPTLNDPVKENNSFINGTNVYIMNSNSTIKFTASDGSTNTASGLEQFYVGGEASNIDISSGSFSWKPGAIGNYSVKVKDNVGNESASRELTVIEDATDPIISAATWETNGTAVISPPEGNSHGSFKVPNKAITLTVLDTGTSSGIESVKVGGQALTGSTWTPTAEGTYTITVTDNIGNASEYDVTVDGTAPTLNDPTVGDYSFIDGTNVYIKDDSSTIKFTASDGSTNTASGLEQFYVGGEASNIDISSGSFSWKPGDIGNYSVKVKDNVGNESASRELTVIEDATDPIISAATWETNGTATITQPNGSSKGSFKVPNKAITLTLSDTGSGIESVKVGAETLTVTDSTCTWTLAAEGTCTITVTDKVGNVSTYDVTVDGTVPTLYDPTAGDNSFISGTNVYIKDDSSTIKFTASDGSTNTASGLEKLYVQKGEETPSEISLDTTTGSYIWKPGDAGTYVVTVKDNVGNESVSQTFVVEVDATLPTITEATWTGDDDETTYSITTITDASFIVANTSITLTSDETSSFKYKVKDTEDTFTDITGSTWDLSTVTTEPTYTLRLIDNVGNYKDYTVTVDGTAPTITQANPSAGNAIVAQPSGGTNGSLIVPQKEITLTVDDDSGSGIVSVEKDGTSLLTDGIYKYSSPATGDKITVTDNVGNSSKYEVTVDNTAPTINKVTVNGIDQELNSATTFYIEKNVSTSFSLNSDASGIVSVVVVGVDTLKASEAGLYTWTPTAACTIIVTDGVGNSTEYTVKVDETAPTSLTLESVTDSYISGSNIKQMAESSTLMPMQSSQIVKTEPKAVVNNAVDYSQQPTINKDQVNKAVDVESVNYDLENTDILIGDGGYKKKESVVSYLQNKALTNTEIEQEVAMTSEINETKSVEASFDVVQGDNDNIIRKTKITSIVVLCILSIFGLFGLISYLKKRNS